MSNNIDLFYDMAIKRIESLENPSEFEIENELLILQKEQHGLESNCIDPNSNLSGVKSAPPFNIALYSARTSELAKKVA